MAYSNQSSGNVNKEIIARIARLERGANLNNASISDGNLYIQGGRLVVSGDDTSIYFEVRDGSQSFMVFTKEGSASRLADPAVWSHDLALVLAGPRTTSSTAGEGYAGSQLDLGDTSAEFLAGMRDTGGAWVRIDQSGNWDIGADRNVGRASVYGFSDGSWGVGDTDRYIIAGATGTVQIVGGLDVFGAKNFVMPHPTKAGYTLRHGATESPVSGTEYTGKATLDAAGEAVVTLPEYFEALNKVDGRTVQLTPVGKPFPVGASEVTDGAFTVYGEPDRKVFWLVKAERFGADFLAEQAEEMPTFENTEKPSGDS